MTFVRPLALPQFPAHRECIGCELHTRAASVGIPTHYLPSSLSPSSSVPCVLFLGQNPGNTEDRQGTPFIGPTGQLLQSAYIAGIHLTSLASIFLSNTARCYHLHGESPTNAHYKACRPHLLPDLHHLASLSSELIVVCLGAAATSHLHALLSVPKVTLTSSFSHQGRQISLPPLPVDSSPLSSDREGGSGAVPGRDDHSDGRGISPPCVRVYTTFHPAACLRTHNLIHAVEGHLTLLLHHLTNRSPVPSTPTLILPTPPPPV